MTYYQQRERIFETLEEIGMGHLVLFETKSRSPKTPYLVMDAPAYHEYFHRNPGELDWADETASILSKRGAAYVLAGSREWPGPDYENWVYNTRTGSGLGDRSRLTGLEIVGPIDRANLTDYMDVHLAEAWPHI